MLGVNDIRVYRYTYDVSSHKRKNIELIAAFFLMLGSGLAVIAVLSGGFSLLLLWPGTAYLVIGLAYIGLGPAVFGKRKDGGIHPVSLCFLFPYLFFL